MKYEYKVILFETRISSAKLNEFGDEGWLLASASTQSNYDDVACIFAKEVVVGINNVELSESEKMITELSSRDVPETKWRDWFWGKWIY